jgi:hypothetical protein
MHAYASIDPVFLAMNQRMHRENPSLGDFCVKCHAPMAVQQGKTTDGTNLSQLDSRYLGVTCFFCHSIASFDGTHPFNAAVTLASDRVMRGEITDAVPTLAHGSKYSPLHDRAQPESAALCGTCHDIVSPLGGQIERTFAEWKASPFSGGPEAGPGDVTSCTASGCHMVIERTPKPIAILGAADGGPLPARQFNEHDFPAVDQALAAPTPFPNAQAEQAAIMGNLSNSLQAALCLTQGGANGANSISVVLDTVGLGHNFPSGAAQDRRLWAEVIACDQADCGPDAGAGHIIYQSGVVPDGVSPADVTNDPDMWLLRDCLFGAQGQLVHMFWQGKTPDGNELLPLKSFTADPSTSHKVRFFPRDEQLVNDAGATVTPASITLRLRLQPIGIDVLNDLVDSGDLDAGVIAALPPPIDIPLNTDGSTTLVWTAAAAADSGVPQFNLPGGPTTCVGTLTSAAAQSAAPTHTNPQCSP